MSASFTVEWRALPQGVLAGGRLRITAFAAIKVKVGPVPTTLAALPGLLHWPALTPKLTVLRGTTPLPTEVLPFAADAPLTSPATAAAWWNAIFPSTTPVIDFARDTLPATVVSYDQAALARVVADIYAKAYVASMGDKAMMPPALSDATILLRNHDLNDGGAGSPTPHGYGAFHAALNRGLHGGRGTLPPIAEVVRAMDFHRRMSALDTLPPLLAGLRLAVPLVIDGKPFAAAAGETITIAPAAIADGQFAASVQPSTAIDPVYFLPRAGQLKPGVLGGMLRVTDDSGRPAVELVTVDPEGAVSKIAALTATAAQTAASDADQPLLQPSQATNGGDAPAGLPSLRLQGFALALHGQEEAVVASAQPRPQNAPLDADLLTLGWRVDVQTIGPQGAAAPWRSLHRRLASYTAGTTASVPLGGPGQPPVKGAGLLHLTDIGDEGFVSQSGAQNAAGAAAADAPLMVSPALAVWKGWSLSVPQPAKHVDPDPAVPADQVQAVGNDVVAGLGLGVHFSGANGLPALRYGREYRFRLRAVDLSGWSVTDWPQPVTGPAAPGDQAAAMTAHRTFLRLDPIAPPVLAYVRQTALAPGVVATADGIEGPQAGESAARLAIRTFAADPKGIVRRTRRLAFPNRATFEAAERHGKLDTGSTLPRHDPAMPFDIPGDPFVALFKVLADRDRSGPDGSAIGLAHAPVALEYVAGATGLAANAASEVRAQSCAPPDPTIPYLPEPLAGATAFTVERVRDVTTLAVDASNPPDFRRAGHPWFDLRPFLVELEAAASAGVRVDRTGPVDRLIVSLPPGQALRVHLRAQIGQDDAALFQVAGWAVASGQSENAVYRDLANNGSWMVTPRRTLDFVHAVDKPLVVPQFIPAADGAVAIARTVGDKNVALTVVTNCDVNSTGLLQIAATWNEPPHGPATPGQPPAVIAMASEVCERTVGAEADSPTVSGAPTGTHQLGFTGNHAFPDTRYRRVDYHIRATSRFREYMPPAIRDHVDQGIMSVHSNPGKRLIPASAAPPPPTIDSVLPTFAWTRQSGLVNVSLRQARSLRIDLGDTWYASGFNEMLAVYIGTGTIDSVSTWGSDPLFPDVLPPALDVAALPRAIMTTKPPVAQLPSFFQSAQTYHNEWDTLDPTTFAVSGIAPHFVDYDPVTGRWFCDIDFAPGSGAYRPMVRLVVGRFQPTALPGCNLSPKTATDYLPVLPDRGVAVAPMQPQFGHAFSLVSIFGFAPKDAGRVSYSAKLQKRAATDAPDAGWTDFPVNPDQPIPDAPSRPPPSLVAGLPLLANRVVAIPTFEAGAHYRLLVQEWEHFTGSGSAADNRLVFFEIVELGHG